MDIYIASLYSMSHCIVEKYNHTQCTIPGVHVWLLCCSLSSLSANSTSDVQLAPLPRDADSAVGPRPLPFNKLSG